MGPQSHSKVTGMEPPPKPIPFSIPLLGVEALRQTHMDPQSWAETVSAVTPVQICEPLRPSRPFLNHSAILPIGGVVMLATQGSAITVATEQHPLAQLLIPYRGWGLWQVERSRFENPMGESLLYVPPAPLRLDNDITSGVALNLNPEALLRTALTMAGPESLPARRLGVFQEPRRLLMADPLAAPLIQVVYTCMGKIDQVAQLPGGELELRRFEDVLLRMVVLLLLPELRSADSLFRRTAPSPEAHRKIQALLEWIEANLERTINLSDLEAQVYWSRRTLQEAFQEACGCSPMQWVRRRRLQRAMRRLTLPHHGDTLTTIGLSVGFSSAVAFNREFRRHYGCPPSALFRA
jgi:AraC-like DNA-binding protein